MLLRLQNQITVILLFSALLLFNFPHTYAQPPKPAAPQDTPIILKGGTIHVGNGKVVQNGAIRFEDGTITWVASADTPVIENAEAKIIDVSGQEVYPGLIAPNTTLGLTEIGAVRATHDYNETGPFNPNVRSIIAYNADSRIPPTVRSNGILLAQITPKGGLLSGTSSIVTLDAWNWEDAAYQMDNGLHLNWPNMFHRKGWWAAPGPTEKNKKWEEEVQQVKQYFKEAQAYCTLDDHNIYNLKFKNMCKVFKGEKKLFIHANFARELISALKFVEQFDIPDVVIVGGADSWRVTDLLKEQNASVILQKPHSLPRRNFESLNQPYKTPTFLQEAGIPFCLMLGGSWGVRNLMFNAGTAAAYGLTKEEALQAVTKNTAEILGIGKKVGTLQPGKDAVIIVSEGDLLDMQTSKVTHAFIQGRAIDLDNKQKTWYRRYKEKYEKAGLYEAH